MGPMKRRVTMSEYVGFDVSKEETAFCVKDKEGKVLARGKAATDPEALFEALKEHFLCPERIVLERGRIPIGWFGSCGRSGFRWR